MSQTNFALISLFLIVFHLLAIFFQTDTLWDLVSDFSLPADGNSVVHGPVICEDILFILPVTSVLSLPPNRPKQNCHFIQCISDV